MSAQLWPRKKTAHAAFAPRAGEPWWVGLSFLLVSLLLCLVLSQAAQASSLWVTTDEPAGGASHVRGLQGPHAFEADATPSPRTK